MDLIAVGDRVINLDHLIGMHVERLADGSLDTLTLEMIGGVHYIFSGGYIEEVAEAELIIDWIRGKAKDISQGPPSREMQGF